MGKIHGLNIAFLLVLLALGAGAILISLVSIFLLPSLYTDADIIMEMQSLPISQEFRLLSPSGPPEGAVHAMDSPYIVNMTLSTPPLTTSHDVSVHVAAGGKIRSTESCLNWAEHDYEGATEISCEVKIPYGYARTEAIGLYPHIADRSTGEREAAGLIAYDFDWSLYEQAFWGSASIMLLIGLGGMAFVLAVLLGMLLISYRSGHFEEYEGEYSIGGLFFPFRKTKTWMQRYRALISSPLFWALELLGLLALIIYILLYSEALASETAFVAFAISGMLALITPFLWTVIIWLADYREREPLRIITSLFLWGGLAALMSIGINSFAGSALELCGLAFLAAVISAPIVEELFKGIGLVLFSLHHEYDNAVDGIVYGFAIGMGFSFIEDWIYLMNNPMGADMWGWFTVFVLRSVMFSANHGVFTSFTGAFIGLLKERKFAFPVFGLLGGMVPAAIFHAVHNSAEIFALFGVTGTAFYCCFLMPLFDYGGLVLIAVLITLGVLFAQPQKHTGKRRS